MNKSEEILRKFDPITLEQMDSVKLMDRTDTKFIFAYHQLEDILNIAKQHYYMLEVEGKRASRYKTLYYDTKDLKLYHRHHAGGLNRYKIRHRTYVESNVGYLEVKFKSNKERTIKDRIKFRETPTQWDDQTKTFLESKTPFASEILVPVLWVNYSRITLVSKSSKERLTIDLDLEFERSGERRDFSSLVIAEVKQEKRSASPFLQIMKSFTIRTGSVSKYCLGIATMYPGVKKNNFKEKIHLINKIIYDHKSVAIH